MMTKFLIAVVSIVVLGYLGTFLGWWGIVLVAAMVGFAVQIHGGLSFLGGLLGGGLFFGIYINIIDQANEGQLSAIMSEMLPFNPFLVTVAIGGLLAAMGMLVGKYARDAFLGEQRNVRYRGRYR